MEEKESRDDWWCEWAIYHATMFGKAASESHLSMLIYWQDFLCKWNVTESEMYEATRVAASTADPKYDSDHLPAIKNAIKIIRQSKKTASQGIRLSKESRRSTCSKCKNTGLRNNEYCQCPFGKLKQLVKESFKAD